MVGSWPPSSEEDPFLFFPCADGEDDPSSYLLYPPGFGPVEDWLVDPMEGQGGELLGLSEDMSRKISLVKEVPKDEILGTAGEETSGVLEAPVTPSEVTAIGGVKVEVKLESEDDDDDDDDDEDADDDDDEDSSSSGEEESSEEEDNKTKRKGHLELEEGEIGDHEIETFSMSSDDENVGFKGPIKSKNEIEDLPLVPPVNASLAPHHQLFPVGVVSSIIGFRVIVEGVEKHNPLNEGSILWLTLTRSPLGIIDEIFGPVKNPFYVVRFNSAAEISDSAATVGAVVSFAAEFAGHVMHLPSLCKKGYDASGENDEEVDEETEFSDDEKEAEYRRSLRQTKRGGGGIGTASGYNGMKEMPFVRGMQATRSNENRPLALPPPLPQSPQIQVLAPSVPQVQGPMAPIQAPVQVFGTTTPAPQVQGQMGAQVPQVQGPMGTQPPVQPFGMAPAAAAFAMMQSMAAFGGQNMFPNMFWPPGVAAIQGMLQNQHTQNQVFPGMIPNQQQFQNQALTVPQFPLPHPGNQQSPLGTATPWQASVPAREQVMMPQQGREEVRGRMGSGGGNRRPLGNGGRRPFSRGGGRFRGSSRG